MARLSVVIPTRNRPQYLLDAVKTVLLHVPGAEIIVCDNSDTPYLHDKIQGLSHSGRINYLYRSETLGMAENFEIAIAAATGDYIICIGDDDCVGPGNPGNCRLGSGKRRRIDNFLHRSICHALLLARCEIKILWGRLPGTIVHRFVFGEIQKDRYSSFPLE